MFRPESAMTRLASKPGDEPPGRERDVSICFIDMRGYTRQTEMNAPADVHRFLTEYFHVVGELIQKHGGTVVEFQGDGVVTAFGAFEDQQDKEATAIRAARAIRAETRKLCIPVRIGIATGTAFVGQMVALDRRAFCVIGTPTVMAARLQGMADELGTGIVIDAATARAAGPLEGARRHRRRAIHGSARRHDLFAIRDEDHVIAPSADGSSPEGGRQPFTTSFAMETGYGAL